MIIPEKYSNQKIFRFFLRSLQLDVIAMGVATILYAIILWSINRGVSVDEGYYLLGYLKDQPVKYALTDFHNIVKSLFFFLPEDNALYLRIIRFVITLFALFVFTKSSYHWLCEQYAVNIKKSLYFSLSFLMGVFCFAYASPVLYYDNIQLIIYLFAFAILFKTIRIKLSAFTTLYCIVLGFLLIFALTNYPPSGIFLFIIIILIYFLYLYPHYKKLIQQLLYISAGMLIGVVIYSLLINNILNVVDGILEIYKSAVKFESTKYETGGQFLIIFRYFTDLLFTVLPVIIATIAHFYIRKLWSKFAIIIDGIFLLILLILIYKLSFFYSNIIILPIIVLLLEYILINKPNDKKFIFRRGFILFLIVLFIPLLAVLGSNQLLARKMFYFMPFWFLALYILYADLGILPNKFQYTKYNLIFIITVSIVFVFQGFLRHPHYNYSIKRSKYPIENAVRFKGIKVSEYQNNFYENGISALNKNGFNTGDNILAFYETYMLVYAAGGYVPDGLTYWAYNFVSDNANIPQKKVDFIIINTGEIEMMRNFLSQTNWNFPESYNKTDLGTDGHNLTQMGYNYILFSARNITNK